MGKKNEKYNKNENKSEVKVVYARKNIIHVFISMRVCTYMQVYVYLVIVMLSKNF